MADMAYFLVYLGLKSLLELWQTCVIGLVMNDLLMQIYELQNCVMQICVLHTCELWIAIFM